MHAIAKAKHTAAKKAVAKKAVPAKPPGPAPGSTEWEIQQEDSFFDHMDQAHTSDEQKRLKSETIRAHKEVSSWRDQADSEHRKTEAAYEAKKKRDAEQRLAAKQYTHKVFEAMEQHRKAIRSRSMDGFKSMEAKELATEVERENPHASAQEIARKAMHLLRLVLHGRSQELPQVQTIQPPL